jgi:hypothetical protein
MLPGVSARRLRRRHIAAVGCEFGVKNLQHVRRSVAATNALDQHVTNAAIPARMAGDSVYDPTFRPLRWVFFAE